MTGGLFFHLLFPLSSPFPPFPLFLSFPSHFPPFSPFLPFFPSPLPSPPLFPLLSPVFTSPPRLPLSPPFSLPLPLQATPCTTPGTSGCSVPSTGDAAIELTLYRRSGAPTTTRGTEDGDRDWDTSLQAVGASTAPKPPRRPQGRGGPSLSCDARCPSDFGIEVGVHRSISHHSHWAQGSWESGCGECWKLWEQGGGGFPLLLMDAPHLQVSVGPGESQQLCSIKVSSG